MSGRMTLRSAWRELGVMKWRVLAVMLILGAGLGMYAGIYSAIDSLFGFRDTLYQRADIAAFELRYSPEDAANIPRFDGIDGIRHVESRLLLPGNVELADGRRLSALLVGMPEDAKVNRLLPAAGDGLDPRRPQAAVIDRNLARHHGFGPGDPIAVNVGNDRLELEVAGVASSAEFLVDGANPNFFLPAKGSLGIVYVPLALMDERLGFRLLNSTVFLGEAVAGDLPAATMAEIESRARQRLTLEEQIPLSRQFGHMFLEVDLNAFRIFTPAIVLIFAVSGLVILFFLLHQWIAQQRQQLGVLAALGYSGGALAARMLLPLAAMAAGGVVFGIGIAWLMLVGFGHEYANAIGLPAPQLALQPVHLLLGAAGLLLACALAAIGPLRQALSVTPLAAVRDQAQLPPQGHGRAANAIGDVGWRYALSAILRRRRSSVMTTLAVALALAPALAYFVAIRSFEVAVVDSFERDGWDYSVDFLSPVWDDELDAMAAIQGVAQVDPFLRGAARFRSTTAAESGLLIGIEPGSSLRVPEVMEGRGLRAGDTDALVMERKLAASLGLVPGDRVEVEGRLGPATGELVGTFSGALPGETFTTRHAARQWLDLEEQNTGALVAATPGADLAAALFEDRRVGKVTPRAAMVHEFVVHLQEIAGIVYLAAAFSIMVALLFLFTSTSFAFMAREGSFALLRILGFGTDTVASMIRREVLLLGGLGVLLALPLGFALAIWLNGILGAAWFHVPTAYHVIDPLVVALPALALLPLVARPVLRRVRALVLADVLRKRSFG
jgi:putative ABC transport system permease protein